MTTRTENIPCYHPIQSRDDLLATFASGEKPAESWTIGTEHEKFVYRLADHRAPSWDESGGIRDLLMAMTEFGWSPVEENGKVIALKGPDGSRLTAPSGPFRAMTFPFSSAGLQP